MPYIVFALIFASYVNQTYRSLDDGLTINGVYSLITELSICNVIPFRSNLDLGSRRNVWFKPLKDLIWEFLILILTKGHIIIRVKLIWSMNKIKSFHHVSMAIVVYKLCNFRETSRLDEQHNTDDRSPRQVRMHTALLFFHFSYLIMWNDVSSNHFILLLSSDPSRFPHDDSL